MINSYVTSALRYSRKNKLHSFINILGLSLGLMVALIAFLFSASEKSFDQFHSKKDRLYRLNKINTEPDGTTSLTAETSGLMGPTMLDEFGEVENFVRYQPWFNDVVLSFQDKNHLINAGEMTFTDPSFFTVFDFPLMRGDPKTALSRPRTIVLSRQTALSLFGTEDALGKTIVGINGIEFEVTGIAYDPPKNSHIQFQVLLSWSTTTPQVGPMAMEWMNNWIAQGITTYILLKPGTDYKNVELKFGKFMQAHLPTRVDKYQLYLQPFEDIYLNSHNLIGTDMSKMGNQEYITLFALIAGFTLFIACINYINISTSKSMRRAREVGMRKTMGAQKQQLVFQFLGESFIVTILSAVLATVFCYVALPLFNNLAGKELTLMQLAETRLLLSFALLILLVTLVAGFYPSFVISSFNPSEVLKSSAQSRITGHWPRQVLITFQFTISILMIAATLIVYQQIRFLLSKDLGFDQEQVVVLNVTDEIASKLNTVKNEINQLPNVASTSMGRTALGQGTSSTYVIPEGFRPDEIEVRMFPADGDFQKTYGLKMTQGRFFDAALASDSNAVVINEALVKRLGWTEPLSKTIRFNEDQPAFPVIGILKDFHFKSLYEEVEPLVMWLSPRRASKISIRFTGNPSDLLPHLETIWKKFESRYPFEFYFVDREFAKSYHTEERLFKTIITFAILSIVIACLGLYGLVSFTLEQRTKEFGIRKVLGASLLSLNVLVNQRFVLLVMLAAATSTPAILYFSNQWLAKFAYKTATGFSPIIIAVLVTLSITILTVSIHALRVGMANPTESLRHE